jgi:hypothetical protein
MSKQTDMAKADAATEDIQPAYWEVHGADIANGNRAWLLAIASSLIAAIAISFAIVVRMQPPTVIQLRPNGEAIVLGAEAKGNARTAASPGQDEFLNEVFVTRFLTTYLNYSPADVKEHWSTSLNMMIEGLRKYTKDALTANNAYGEVEDDQVESTFHLRELDKVPGERLTYLAYGVKDVHHLVKGLDTTDHFVNGYHIQLRTDRRSKANPYGLWIISYSEWPIEGERRNQILAVPDTEETHE